MKKSFLKTVTGDFMYSIAAMIIFNGVLQLAVYPFLNKYMGAEAAGAAISLMSVVTIVGSSLGSSANNSRLIRRVHYDVGNDDFNIYLLISCAIAILIAAVSMFITKQSGIMFFILFSLLMILTIGRYYGNVEYRLNLNYKGYFIYHLLIGMGYLLGMGLFLVTKQWMIIIITGELAALIFVYFYGNIYRPFTLKRSEHFGQNMKSMIILTGSGLLNNLASNADKLIIAGFVGTFEVTVLHASSIIGRIISLFTVPLNSVLIGYITSYKGTLKRKHFFLIGAVLLGIGIIMAIVCTIASRIFVGILYENVFEYAKQYFLVANAGPIFYFISSTYILILLRFTSESYQFAINLISFVLLMAISIPATILYKLDGMVYAVLIVNMLKFLCILAVGMWKIKD